MFTVAAVRWDRGLLVVFLGGSTHCRTIGSTVSTREHHSAGRMLSSRWPTNPAPPPQDGCSWFVCACVHSPMCVHIYMCVHTEDQMNISRNYLLA